MIDPADVRVVLMDGATAATLAQVLPLLLLTLMVELRRVEVHHRGHNVLLTRVLLGLFFIAFGVAETVFVLSIDGEFLPFTWSDLISALSIFALLALLFVLSLLDTPERKKQHQRRGDADSS